VVFTEIEKKTESPFFRVVVFVIDRILIHLRRRMADTVPKYLCGSGKLKFPGTNTRKDALYLPKSRGICQQNVLGYAVPKGQHFNGKLPDQLFRGEMMK